MKIASLHIYPIKSCGGIDLEQTSVGARGPALDRRYMVVDSAGRFISQRSQPGMALISVNMQQEQFRVSTPGAPPLFIPHAADSGGRRIVSVWSSSVEALIEPEGSAWFSKWLDRPLQLVYLPDDVERSVDPDYARPGDRVGFADGFPLLLASQASLQDLNDQLVQPVGIDRFRANVVIDGCVPWAEESWKQVTLGGLQFRSPKPCERCSVITIDQKSAQRTVEPLKTLTRHHAPQGRPLFGMNLIPDQPGTLRVGDPVVAST